jgi:hypothetical protein
VARIRAVAARLLLALLPQAVLSQEVRLELGEGRAALGSRVEVPLWLTTDVSVAGLEIAFAWDRAAGSGVELRDLAVPADANGVLGHLVQVRGGEAIFLLALHPRQRLLGPGRIRLGTLVIDRPAGGPPTESEVVFRDGTIRTMPPGLLSPIVNTVTVLVGARVVELNREAGLELLDGRFVFTAPPGGLGPFNPNGFIQTHGWSFLLPLATGVGADGGGPANMKRNTIAPSVIGDPNFNPQPGQAHNGTTGQLPLIDFGGAASTTGSDQGNLVPRNRPIWFSTGFLESPAGLALPEGFFPRQDRVCYDCGGAGGDGIINILNREIVPILEGPPLPIANQLAIAVTYVRNLGPHVLAEMCTGSDDSIQVWCNNKCVLNQSIARGYGFGCLEVTPFLLPSGVSKFAVLIWQGAGGWNFGVGIRIGGVQLADGNGVVDFLGPNTGGLTGQQQYCVDRRLTNANRFNCPQSSQNVVIQGDGSGDAGQTVTVTECILGSAAEIAIFGVSHGGVVSDRLPPDVVSSPVGKFEDHYVAGSAPCGGASTTTDLGGDAYSSVANTGGDIWDSDDRFEFAYNRWVGDFDFSVRMDLEVNVGAGRWGKYGLMARQGNGALRGLHNTNAFAMVQSHYTTDESIQTDNARFAGRTVSSGGGGMFEDVGPLRHPRYLRLTRRGAIVNGWIAGDADDPGTMGVIPALEADPCNDLNWTAVGRDYHYPGGTPDCLYVGYANSGQNSQGCALQQTDFTVLCCEGTPCPAAPIGRTITWNVTRGELNSGLNYTLAYGINGNTLHSGDVESGGSPVAITGGPTSFAWAIQSGPVGKFQDSHDVGGPPAPGSISYNPTSGTYTQSGSGADIWDGGDEMHFAYKEVAGDFRATMRILNATNPPNVRWGRMGIMARQTCAPNSKYSLACVPYRGEDINNNDPKRHQARRDHLTNGTNYDRQITPQDPDCVAETPPGWVRLSRCGNYFFSEFADDVGGVPGPWCYAGGDTWPPGAPGTVLVGTVSSSHNTAGGNLLTYEFQYSCEPATRPNRECARLDPLYSANFDVGLPPGDYISNNFTPAAVGGRLRVTEDAIAGTAAQAHLDTDGLDLGDRAFSAEFDVYFFTDFTPLPADGGVFAVTEGAFASSIGRLGDAGSGMGWLIGDHNFPQGPRRSSFAVEFDSWDGGHGDDDPPGGFGGNAGGQRWHTATAFNEVNLSAQNQVDFGVGPTFDLFLVPEGAHVEVYYSPIDDDLSRITTWLTANDGSYPRSKVGEVIGPRLHGECYLTFAGGTGGASQTMEVDNVVVTELCCELPDAVWIDQGPGPIALDVGDMVVLTATGTGADGVDGYSWDVAGSISGGAFGNELIVTCTGAPGGTVTVRYGDGVCGDSAEDSIEITCVPSGGGQIPGDCNQDGRLDLTDAVCLLGFLFIASGPAGTMLPCGPPGGMEPDPSDVLLMDANGDGNSDLADAISLLAYLFGVCGFPPCPAHVLGIDCVGIPDCPEVCRP